MTDAQQVQLNLAKRVRDELRVQLALSKLAHSRKRLVAAQEWLANAQG